MPLTESTVTASICIGLYGQGRLVAELNNPPAPVCQRQTNYGAETKSTGSLTSERDVRDASHLRVATTLMSSVVGW